MKQATLVSLLILLCLMRPWGLTAAETDDEVITPLLETLQAYVNNGYNVQGPVQYLGKTGKVINVYRQRPIAYDRIEIINQFREPWFVFEEDIVYILSKNGHIVLIRVHRDEGGANAR